MSDFNTISNSDFMSEKIKERPINRRKLMRRLIITVSMAVIFGLVACFTILLLEPVISNWLYPEAEPHAVVIFPEEEEEMSPEEMLADNLPENQTKEEALGAETATPKLDQEQVEKILDSVELDRSHYIQLYNVIESYVKEISTCMVVVSGVEEEYDWMENSYESVNDTSGLVIAKSGGKIYILSYVQPIKKADKILVTFSNGKRVEASLLQKNSATDLAVLTVDASLIGTEEEIGEIKVAIFGSSREFNMVGNPVVALGSPMGITDSAGYGMVAAVSVDTSAEDYDYDILTTDIYGSSSGRGFLFNMKGQVIGVLVSKNINPDLRNIISAYGISDLKKLITILSSGKEVPYFGIKGISVTEEANAELQIPYGAYVTDVVFNSPAMLAGLQQGDIIIGANEEEIGNFSDFERFLYNAEVGKTIKIRIMRQSQDAYKEMSMDVTLAGAN